MDQKRPSLVSLAMAGILGLGFLLADVVPVTADPPQHAPAHGYRNERERRNNQGRRVRRRPHGHRHGRLDRDEDVPRRRRVRGDFDRDGILDRRDRDIDGDGIPNRRDRFPRDPDRA